MSPTVMDRVKASRGRTHMFDRLDPARTAHIIVDLQDWQKAVRTTHFNAMQPWKVARDGSVHDAMFSWSPA